MININCRLSEINTTIEFSSLSNQYISSCPGGGLYYDLDDVRLILQVNIILYLI